MHNDSTGNIEPSLPTGQLMCWSFSAAGVRALLLNTVRIDEIPSESGLVVGEVR